MARSSRDAERTLLSRRKLLGGAAAGVAAGVVGNLAKVRKAWGALPGFRRPRDGS